MQTKLSVLYSYIEIFSRLFHSPMKAISRDDGATLYREFQNKNGIKRPAAYLSPIAC